jgi:hypothetical protein
MVNRGLPHARQAGLLRLALAVFCCGLLAVRAHAGAWNDRPEHGELIMTTSMFRE